MVQKIELAAALEIPGAVFIDVRSPSEYRQDSLPNAVNIPLLSDQERADIGKVYHQQGPEQAKILGLRTVSPRLDQIVQQYKEIARGHPVIVFCWRGGQRSQSVAALLEAAGITVYCLDGGYRAYRRKVKEYLYDTPLKPTVVVLHGLTGVGKTEVLGELEKLGLAVVDLEKLACHRGSAFGSIGLPVQPTQKTFESRLFHLLKSQEQERFLVTECESRRIGRLMIPPVLFAAMNCGLHVLLYADRRTRVARLLRIYHDSRTDHGELSAAINQLVPRLGRETVNRLQDQIQAGNLEPVVETLLTDYYDPLYGYPEQADESFDLSVNAADTGKAAQAIKEFLAVKTMKKGSG